MADLSPPPSSVEETHGRQQRQHSPLLGLLRSISSEEQLVGGCGVAAAAPASGETPPTPPATTRASTAISGSAETDNEEEEDLDEQETTIGIAAPVVVEQQHSEPVLVPEPHRFSPPPPTLSLPAAVAAVVDITTTPATPEAQEEEEELSMPSIKTVPKRDGPKQSSSSNSKPRPAPVSLPLPPLRQVSDSHSSTITTTTTTTSTTTPLSPSSLSRVLREEGVRSPGHPSITALPPSPPLTRRGTNNTRTTSSSRYGPQAIAVRGGSPGALRPGTSSSNASLRDVSRMGKKLGRQPIDYLLPNGSLTSPVSTNFHPWQEPDSLENSPDTDQPVSAVFTNLNILLENYHSILSNGGSIAVANGYHSVARKLLEQVGSVFTRDLGVDGIGWHDILEYIRGGRARPCLCVLPVKGLMSRRNIEASILSGTTVDDDVVSYLHPPSMYITKELAQSVVAGVKQKTGKVEDWLEEVEKVLKRSQPPPSPTVSTISDDGEFDEHSEIVVQIIEGILNHTQILVFRAYLSDPHIIATTKLALVRLYPQHTPAAITAPIIALYLLLHDELHPLLTAVSKLTDAEMELINSGRFDGFLDGSSNAVPRDEEEELDVITKLDKRLLEVIERLDDEIEELHNRTLVVRRALKERQNCISKKMKKRSLQQLAEGGVPTPSQTPIEELEDENELLLPPVEEWEGGKSILLGPDDSASNVTFNRRRRAERRIEKEREEAEKKKAEKKARRIEERDETGGRRERKKKTDEEDAIAEDDDDATVDGRSVTHRKERKERKERREKHHCDNKENCEDCSSSGAAVKRSRSGGRREEPETIKEETKEELKELKEKASKSSSTKDTKEKHRHKAPKEEKEKDPKKGGLFDATRRLFDKKMMNDKPSKSDKEKDKDRPATGSSGKSSERERPPTSQSHRGGGHSHREGDHHREVHREIKI